MKKIIFLIIPMIIASYASFTHSSAAVGHTVLTATQAADKGKNEKEVSEMFKGKKIWEAVRAHFPKEDQLQLKKEYLNFIERRLGSHFFDLFLKKSTEEATDPAYRLSQEESLFTSGILSNGYESEADIAFRKANNGWSLLDKKFANVHKQALQPHLQKEKICLQLPYYLMCAVQAHLAYEIGKVEAAIKAASTAKPAGGAPLDEA